MLGKCLRRLTILKHPADNLFASCKCTQMMSEHQILSPNQCLLREKLTDRAVPLLRPLIADASVMPDVSVP
jgi:hypothetical protein